MTVVTLRPYDVDNVTAGTVFDTATDIVEDIRHNRTGTLTFRFQPGVDAAGAAAADEEKWIRVREDGTEVRAYRVVSIRKFRDDSSDVADAVVAEVRCSSSLAATQYAGVWFQGEGKRYAYPDVSSIRWFGFMSDSYDDTAWASAYTIELGAGDLLVRDAPFGTGKHADHPDPGALFVWSDAADGGADPSVGECFFRDGTFEVTDRTQVVVAVSARHEFECYLDGALILSASHPEASAEVQTIILTLAAGTHTIAFRCEALAGPGAPSTTEAWLTASVVEVVDGIPTGADEVTTVDAGGATGGTFTLTVEGVDTVAIDYDASASQVRDAVQGTGTDDEDVVVSVSGEGTVSEPWVITFDGWRVARRDITVTGSSSLSGGSGLTVTETTAGSAPTVLWRTGDDPVKVDAYPSATPGTTVGQALIDVIDAANTRGVDLGLNGYDFTASVDSDAVAWATEVQVAVPATKSILQMLEQLVDDVGVDIDVDVTGQVQCWQRRGTDRTATVDLDGRGAGTGNADVGHTVQERTASHALIQHQGGWTVTSGPGKRRETFLQFGQVGTDASAAALGVEAMRDLQVARDGNTFELDDSDVPVTLVPGDLVTATDVDRFQVDQRVVAVRLVQTDTSRRWTVETTTDLGLRRGPDRLDEADVLERVARAIELMAPGTGGGRVRSAHPNRYLLPGSARAVIGAPLLTLAAIADQEETEGDAVSISPSAAGGVAPYTWSATGLPAGVTINTSTGAISGDADADESDNSPFSVTVTVVSADGQEASRTFEFVVNAPAAVVGQYMNLTSDQQSAKTADKGTALTGDIDLRVDVELGTDDYVGNTALISQIGNAGQQSVGLLVSSAGNLRYFYSDDGSTGDQGNSVGVFVPAVAARKQYRITLDFSGTTVTFYTRDATLPLTDNTGWTLEETTSDGSISNVFNATVDWRVGESIAGSDGPDVAKVYEAMVLDGIDGTPYLRFNADDFTSGDGNGNTAVSSTTGETWELLATTIV